MVGSPKVVRRNPESSRANVPPARGQDVVDHLLGYRGHAADLGHSRSHLAAAFGLGFLAFAPTAITGLLGKLITGVWMWVIGLVAPKARPHAPGLGGQLVGMVGAGFGFLLASQATETAFQLIAAGALVALSYFVLLNSSSKVTSTSAFMLIGLAFWIAGEGIARGAGLLRGVVPRA